MWSALLPAVRPSLSVRECRAAGSASGQTACPFSSHTPPVSVPPWPHESSPLPRARLCPSYGLDVCFFFIYLVSDFLVRFSDSSGCARRQCVHLYAAILVLRIF